MRNITVKVDDLLLELLDSLAQVEGKSRSELVREAIACLVAERMESLRQRRYPVVEV